MPETETTQLIRQAARELEIENISVGPSLDKPGFYVVVQTVTVDTGTATESGLPIHEGTIKQIATISMGAEFKSIIETLKAGANQ